MLDRDRLIKVEHIYWEGNHAADFLASLGHKLRIGVSHINISDPTSSLSLSLYIYIYIYGQFLRPTDDVSRRVTLTGLPYLPEQIPKVKCQLPSLEK
ncbi:hypothetical protein LINGRAHAP2_LOCUS4809 [Linum grandiflorum]